jgi:23S rRNA (adenine2503-C2)-methyltransferase
LRHPDNHIFEHTPDSLAAWCAERGWPSFRAKQILEWVYAKGVVDPHAMSNLPARDRETLAASMSFLSGDALAHQVATDGTQKLLVQWSDGAPEQRSDEGADRVSLGVFGDQAGDPTRQTECVMIPASGEGRERKTACISSQVGCPVGCRFCASGLGGLDGNLSAGRIVEQVWRLSRLPNVERISNVVFMGMGEPLANFQAVTQAVRTIAAPWGLGIGARKITISTVGLPRAIERLAEQMELPVTLALSLHAPNDDLRRELIPWAEYTSIEELLRACDAWFKKTGREITLEYILLGGVNDQAVHARELVQVASSLRGNVNLIRYNEVDGLPYVRPTSDDVHTFQHILREGGVKAHIRASRGRDIAAACGQLRHESAGAA